MRKATYYLATLCFVLFPKLSFSAEIVDLTILHKAKTVEINYRLLGNKGEKDDISVTVLIDGVQIPHNQLTLTGDLTDVPVTGVKKIVWDVYKNFSNGITGVAEISVVAKESANYLAEQELVARNKKEKERLLREKAEQERIAQEKIEQDRIAKERAEKERIVREKAEQERLAKEKAEQERAIREMVLKELNDREKDQSKPEKTGNRKGNSTKEPPLPSL